jgi:hypothetical protein
MSGIVEPTLDAVGLGSRNEAIDASRDEASANRAWQEKMWDRQYGPINDTLMNYLQGVMGAEDSTKPVESEWQKDYQDSMRQEIDSGLRPSEEAARAALRERVNANPAGMSNQGYARGLRDIVREGGRTRGDAFRKGMGEAKLLPFNMAMSFMGRTPYKPDSSNYMPNYTSSFNPQAAQLMGAGLNQIANWGRSTYDSLMRSGAGSSLDFSSLNASDAFQNYADLSPDDINWGMT